MFKDLLRILPAHIHGLIETLSKPELNLLEEIRIRVHRPLELLIAGKPVYPKKNNNHYEVTLEDAQIVLNQLSEYSLYAFEEELRRGYITIQGGHRVGITGKVVLEKGAVQTMRSISSFNIRIARQKKGQQNI